MSKQDIIQALAQEGFNLSPDRECAMLTDKDGALCAIPIESLASLFTTIREDGYQAGMDEGELR